MQITPVAEILGSVGLREPRLNALVPNEENYKVLLIQPQGEIDASDSGVRNRDRDLARRQFRLFLRDAIDTQADLVVTPEYSLPWEILVESIKAGSIPAQGKLWALGCESIRLGELEALKQGLANFATVLHEPLETDAARFTDPLAYVFAAPPFEIADAAKPVILVQFKTHPMGDDDHFEINRLRKGTVTYQFGGSDGQLKLVSLICSDVFAFTDAHARAIYDRALVIHIQLNAKPRQTQYRRYRDRLLAFQGDTTELICLNWASDVREWCGRREKPCATSQPRPGT